MPSDRTPPGRPPAAPLAPQAFRGEALGLPQTGSGSIAPAGARIGAFLVDCVASGLVAALFVPHHGSTANSLPGLWSLVPFAIDYIVGVLVAGRTLGMYLFRLRLIRVDRDAPVTPWRILGRTVLLIVFVPALVFDRDGRGMHDKVAETAVVRA